jgi:2-oxoglutarate ferredoxin oxidoreductase subunit alpha
MKRIEAINDFVIKFANVNGSGSASANELFAKAILRMGVPVSPRNIFPSNIQGMPTWYEARVCEKGYLGRRGGVDMMVAMNPQTWDADVAEITPGGYLFYDSTRPIPAAKFRPDIAVIGVPLTEISNSAYTEPRQRQLFKNIIYVGALSVLLDVEAEVFEKALCRAVQGQGNAARIQRASALHLGRDYVRAHLQAPLGIRVQPGRRGGRPHFYRRQQRSRPGLCVRRRHGGGLVPDHTLIVGARGVPEILRQVPRGPGHRPQQLSLSCRPRTNWPPSAWWWARAGTAPVPSRPPRARASR